MQKLCTLQELLQHKGVIEARMGCILFFILLQIKVL